jgi:hypothetical protein
LRRRCLWLPCLTRVRWVRPQPFFSTEVLSELVERSEAAHLKLLEAQKAAAANGDATQTSPETPPTLIRMEVRSRPTREVYLPK